MTGPDWDDDRLAAAFRELVDRPIPPTMIDAIHDRILGTRPGRSWTSSWTAPIAAGVVVVLALVGVSLIVTVGGLSDSSPTRIAAGSATPGHSVVTDEPPGTVSGLATLSVRRALAVRDGGTDDRELAVEGWFTPAPVVACPAQIPTATSPLQPDCPGLSDWMSEDAESLVHATDDHLSFVGPNGARLIVDLDGIDSSWYPPLPEIGTSGGSTPARVVLIGHFDDRRAALCPDNAAPECRDRFVVDNVAWADRPTQPQDQVDLLNDATAVSTIDRIRQILAGESPDGTILSTTTVDPQTAIAALEPTLGRLSALRNASALWIVRVLESGRMTTYVVVDGTDAIFEMNNENDPVQVGGSPAASPSAATGSWPPVGAITFDLTSQVAVGAPPVRLAVVDESERVTDIAETGDVDPSTAVFDGRFGAYAEPGHPGRVHLAWIGGICDSQITITITAGIRSVVFDMGPQPDCDTMGILRQAVLDFDRPVNVVSIELLEAGATPSAQPEGDYVLDCGPLGPDTCATKAAAIIDAQVLDHPSVHVVSIVFLDACGSYVARFDDESGVTGNFDCVLP